MQKKLKSFDKKENILEMCNDFKGTLRVILSHLPCKDVNARSTKVPLKLLIKNVKETVVFHFFIFSLLLKSKKCASRFRRETSNEN